MGSRPAVGSSRNSTSGSSASARARAARLTMPPDSSSGYLHAALAGRPASASFSRARCSASRRSSPACSISGSATFSCRFSEVNNAPRWNSTPKRRSTCERRSADSSSRFSPNTLTLPAFGRRRPTMLRRSTDLPVPDPPTTPRISPRRMSRSRPSCTVWLPKRLTSPRTWISASSLVTSPSP